MGADKNEAKIKYDAEARQAFLESFGSRRKLARAEKRRREEAQKAADRRERRRAARERGESAARLAARVEEAARPAPKSTHTASIGDATVYISEL